MWMTVENAVKKYILSACLESEQASKTVNEILLGVVYSPIFEITHDCKDTNRAIGRSEESEIRGDY